MSNLIQISGNNLLKRLEDVSGHKINKSESINRYVYLLVDCSGSMSELGKMESAKKGAINFSTEAIKKNYKVGLVSFGIRVECRTKPQESVAGIKYFVSEMMAGGTTPLTEALDIAIDDLTVKFGERIICVVTDGYPDNRDTAIQSADKAKCRGIDIMTIGTEDADHGFLRRISTRKELSVSVSTEHLQIGIKGMAEFLLPGK
jgi:Mg-chelatase subunit ChlD